MIIIIVVKNRKDTGSKNGVPSHWWSVKEPWLKKVDQDTHR